MRQLIMLVIMGLGIIMALLYCNHSSVKTKKTLPVPNVHADTAKANITPLMFPAIVLRITVRIIPDGKVCGLERLLNATIQ